MTSAAATHGAANTLALVLDFKEMAQDGNDFELLTRELLFARDMRAYWSGRGADGGRDLLAVEVGDPTLGAKERRWVVSCKHFAHADRSVGNADLGEISDICAQHQAEGFLLVCSTHLSAGAVERLDAIERNQASRIATHYWDGVTLERLLTTPAGWAIAQRFMPVSATGWRVWATDAPNRWIVAYMGHVVHLANRIASSPDFPLTSLGARIDDIQEINDSLPTSHELALRAMYWDDKGGFVRTYIDYLCPTNGDPVLNAAALRALLGDDAVLEDGQFHGLDLRLVRTHPYSDHYDRNHYSYYEPFAQLWAWGDERSKSLSDFAWYHGDAVDRREP